MWRNVRRSHGRPARSRASRAREESRLHGGCSAMSTANCRWLRACGQGILAKPIRRPLLRGGTSRIDSRVTAAHTEAQHRRPRFAASVRAKTARDEGHPEGSQRTPSSATSVHRPWTARSPASFTQMQTWIRAAAGDEPVIIDPRRATAVDTRGRKVPGNAISSLWVNVQDHHRAGSTAPSGCRIERWRTPRCSRARLGPPIEIGRAECPRAPGRPCAGEPGADQGLYSDSGARRWKSRWKMAFQHWKKKKNSSGSRRRGSSWRWPRGIKGHARLGEVRRGGLVPRDLRTLLFECLRIPAPYAYGGRPGPKHCLRVSGAGGESMIHGPARPRSRRW